MSATWTIVVYGTTASSIHPNATHLFPSSNSQRCHATANCTLRAENVVLCAAICIGETCKCSYCSRLGTSINFKIKQWSNWIYANHTETHVGSFPPSPLFIFIPVCTYTHPRLFFFPKLIKRGGRLKQHAGGQGAHRTCPGIKLPGAERLATAACKNILMLTYVFQIASWEVYGNKLGMQPQRSHLLMAPSLHAHT